MSWQKAEYRRNYFLPSGSPFFGLLSRLSAFCSVAKEFLRITSMAFGSAWGRWFSAQHLVNNGTPIGHRYLIHTAARIVMDKILDGDLAVRGRRPGRLEYEDIARTDWRSSAFYVVDDPISLWRLVICPRGVVEIEPDGTVHASDSIAAGGGETVRATACQEMELQMWITVFALTFATAIIFSVASYMLHTKYLARFNL